MKTNTTSLVAKWTSFESRMVMISSNGTSIHSDITRKTAMAHDGYVPSALNFGRKVVDPDVSSMTIKQATKLLEDVGTYKPKPFIVQIDANFNADAAKPAPSYVPTAALTPSKIFKPMEISSEEILAVWPTATAGEQISVRNVIAQIDRSDFDRSVSRVGIDEQELVAKITAELHNMIPENKDIEAAIAKLGVIKDLVTAVRLGKQSFFSSIFEVSKKPIDVRNEVNKHVQELRKYSVSLIGYVRQCATVSDTMTKAHQLLMFEFNAARVLRNKVEEKSHKVLDSRRESIYISCTVAEQTLAIVDVKAKNIQNLIDTIQNIVLTGIPSWFNSLEIATQDGLAEDLKNNSVLQPLLESQQEIINNISSVKGVK